MPLKSAFAERIHDARKGFGYTQAQVAEAVSISTRWYQQIERGRFLPETTVMIRLLIVLELDPEEFREEVGLGEEIYILRR